LVGAEECYDRSLKLFRQYADEDSLNYANTVRYPAVIKNRLGKRAESKELWLEALDRYSQLKMPVAVAEASAWLAIFAIEEGDRAGAEEWLEKAQHAAAAANDPDTNKWVEEAKLKVKT
jgi:tetratricopeptide (TPR) repeat protein